MGKKLLKLIPAMTVFLLSMLIISGIIYAKDENVKIYKITPDMEEWKELGTVGNKIEACRVDEEILQELSTAEVLQAVLDFPFIIDLFVYDKYSTGIESLEKNSDAYNELLNRPDAKDIIIEWISVRKENLKQASDEELIQNEEVMIMLLYTEKWVGELQSEDIEIIDGFSEKFTTELTEINSAWH